MRHILDIGHNDLRLFFKSKTAYIWLFGVPTLFIYFLGLAFRGPGDPGNRRPPVVIENLDTNFLGRLFLEELGAQGMELVDPTNHTSAARGIRIPADFTSRVLQGQACKVEFSRRENSNESDAAIIELRLVRALIAMNGHILEAVAQTNAPAMITETGLRRVMASPNPVSLNARFAGRNPMPTSFNFSLPGNLVSYLMMNLLIFGGSALAMARRQGIIKRMLVHPVRRSELVAGKIYGLVLLGSAQIVFFLVLGKFVFHVNLGANLPAVLLTLLVLAWVAGSLGVLIGSLVAAEDRVIAIAVLSSLLMAALGGCWWPVEIGPPMLKTLALCLPTGWALEALNQVISFGNGFSAILKPVAVLAVFGCAANVLAARFFRA
jgi:ABC-type multidrug transport system permease subunit